MKSPSEMMLKEKLKETKVQAAVIGATFILFLIATFMAVPVLPILLGIVIAAEIFFFVGFEVKEGVKKHGWKHEVLDTLAALAIAVLIWYGAGFLLNTESPVSGVVSCSMLPNLQRGDFVFVQGAEVKAYDIEMTRGQLESLNQPAHITYGNNSATIDGSIFPYCVSNRNSDMCNEFVENPDTFKEEKGAFTYRYERCHLAFKDGTEAYQPCVKSVEFEGTEYLTNFSNDVIIFQPPKEDFYSLIGDIVHRTFFRINVDGEYYYLTRGDNNPFLDLQAYDYGTGMMNRPVPEEYLRGKVIGRLPFLGYFKLFISGFFTADPQCDMQLEFEHVG
jgi:hypothetical protein